MIISEIAFCVNCIVVVKVVIPKWLWKTYSD